MAPRMPALSPERIAVLRRWLAFACVLPMLLGACASVPALATQGAAFVVVRHAEKAVDGSHDPALSDQGRARAQALAQRLAAAPLVAAYATEFQRTQQTAQPAAAMQHLAVTTYAAAMPAADLAAILRVRHASGTVLVVGHSNTVPDIVAALCDCPVTPLGEGDFDAVYTVHGDADGHGVLDVERQSFGSAPAPATDAPP
jgi:broad specificity phosphatase PhoE